MNYEIDKTENDLKNMFVIFNPKQLDNIKIVDEENDIIYNESNINDLYKRIIEVAILRPL